jgi:hypothetical protein
MRACCRMNAAFPSQCPNDAHNLALSSFPPDFLSWTPAIFTKKNGQGVIHLAR